jgi:hypothetical protein
VQGGSFFIRQKLFGLAGSWNWYRTIIFFFIFKVLLPIADISSDVWSAASDFNEGHTYWATITFLLVMVSGN